MEKVKTENNKKIAIITACTDDWGGSEELWAKAVPLLRSQGHQITLLKARINFSHPEFVKLHNEGVTLVEINPQLSFIKRVFRKIRNISKRISSKNFWPNHSKDNFKNFIKDEQPDLVIIGQGINFDGLAYAHQCLLLNLNYVVIAQKAVDFFWPYPADRDYMKKTLLKATACLFVSEHNRTLTQEQFGIKLDNSRIVFNPVKTNVDVLPPPPQTPFYYFACVARLFIIDKGQDILLRIMAKKKWKERPLKISFIGSGQDQQALEEMASYLGLENVCFKGYEKNIQELWKSHHALILPSRSEGLPLSMIEAMSVGRPVIVSNAGGNAEVIRDGVNGFIGEATEHDFEKAMERAWERREDWEHIGKNASSYIGKNIPKSPEKDFANYINNLLNEF